VLPGRWFVGIGAQVAQFFLETGRRREEFTSTCSALSTLCYDNG
jgi:hypothetical protein